MGKLRPVKKLRIRVISGHHLPKSDGKIKGNVIQPYVRIKIRGHCVDTFEYVTEVVPKVKVLKNHSIVFPYISHFLEWIQSNLGMLY